METLSPDSSTTLKRSAFQAEIGDPPAKRSRQTYHHHHRLQYKSSIPQESEPALLDQQQYDQIFERAIVQMCQSVGEETGSLDNETSSPIIPQTVLSTFREHAEEYLLNLCYFVRTSMQACRRIQPLPVDFEFAMKFTSLRFDSLIPELKRSNNAIIPELLPTPPPESATTASLSFLGDEFDSKADSATRKYIPSNFPAFPSKHTFRHTSVYTEREQDPRRIRELAAEEGRLGEQALRKLAGAVRTEAKIDRDDKGKDPDRGESKAQKANTLESMFEKTMQAVMRKETEEHPETARVDGDAVKLELAPIVNCERKYSMPDSMLKLRKEAELVAEKAVEKRREDLRTARRETLVVESAERVRSSSTPRPKGSAQPAIKREPQRSGSTTLKLKLKLGPKAPSRDMSIGRA
ncbi:MAG: hypothetical protein Q9227_001412 [Pyrenula ochraceoflavens]